MFGAAQEKPNRWEPARVWKSGKSPERFFSSLFPDSRGVWGWRPWETSFPDFFGVSGRGGSRMADRFKVNRGGSHFSHFWGERS